MRSIIIPSQRRLLARRGHDEVLESYEDGEAQIHDLENNYLEEILALEQSHNLKTLCKNLIGTTDRFFSKFKNVRIKKLQDVTISSWTKEN